MAVQILRWQFTVADFARMVEAGILAEDDRVELIDGEVRAMGPIGPRHIAIVNRLNALISRQVADSAIISVQNPIQLTDYTEPQPDIAVLRPREDFYAHALPLPADVLLVVEVAESSLEYDREEKAIRTLGENVLEVDASRSLRELAEEYEIVLPRDAGYTTLAGFVLARLGFIPRGGEAFTHDGRRYTVLEMDGRRVAKVKVEKLSTAATTAGGAAGAAAHPMAGGVSGREVRRGTEASATKGPTPSRAANVFKPHSR